MRKPTMWFPNRSNTNQAVQSQKQAGSLKFQTLEEEEVYYPCSENKGADQLRGYREADLSLCFRIGKNLVFSRCGSFHSRNCCIERKTSFIITVVFFTRDLSFKT